MEIAYVLQCGSSNLEVISPLFITFALFYLEYLLYCVVELNPITKFKIAISLKSKIKFAKLMLKQSCSLYGDCLCITVWVKQSRSNPTTLHYLCIILSRVSTLLQCGTNPITKLKIAISLKSKTNLQS